MNTVSVRLDVPNEEIIESADDNAVMSPPEVRMSLDVDIEALRLANLYPESGHERLFGDQLRSIKRPILKRVRKQQLAGARDASLVMVASALPGDGKTFISVNLAMSMARERDFSVLLVDADVAKPNISHAFGVEDRLGLLDALDDEAIEVESLVLPTNVPGLELLPAGTPRESATELLASLRMTRVLGELGSRNSNRVVLFDSPPLLLSSESHALVGSMGQLVLVVRIGTTPQRAVNDVLQLIGGSKPVGVVFNDSNTSRSGGYYGYGTYGYGSYGVQLGSKAGER